MKKSELKQLIKEVLQEVTPEPTNFKLNIKLGNEAATFETVPDMLMKVAEKIKNGRTEGGILDLNGNVVGEYLFTDD